MTDLDRARQLLSDGVYTCVLIYGEHVLTSRARGVKPLVNWLDSGMDLSGFSAADKVIGKATAFLYVHFGIRQVFSRILSEGAKAVFDYYGVSCAYEELTPGILNRRGDGPCPMEDAVRDISSVGDAIPAILARYRSLNA